MFGGTFRSETVPASPPRLPGYIRADARLAARFAPTPRGTRALELAECGGYRLKFPRGPRCEAMIVNTGGGMTGGDRLALDFQAESGAHACISTQSAEKLYRAEGDPARINIRLSLAPGATLHWLPQETILFDGARLERRLEVEIGAGARFALCEMLVCGRTAMGETLRHGRLRDSWRIRREGRLVLAEALRLGGDIAATLARPAVAGGTHAFATLLLCADQAETLTEGWRARLDEVASGSTVEAGISGWNGLLVARLLSSDALALRRAVLHLLSHLPGVVPPRIWHQ